MEPPCEHLEEAVDRRDVIRPRTHGCEECLKAGTRWVQLRLCLSCGHVGCCDSSPGRHATAHYHQTKHPVMRSYEPRADWMWCYVDEEMLEGVTPRGEEATAVHYAPP